MTTLIRRPLLVSGLGLGAILWLWANVQSSVSEWGEWVTLGAIAWGGIWWWRQNSGSVPVETLPSPVNRETLERAFTQVEGAILLWSRFANAELATEDIDISSWQNRLDELKAEIHRQTLRIAITGGKNVGKSSLFNLLSPDWQIVETPALFTPNPSEDLQSQIEEQHRNSDVILLVIGGDLTDSEYQTLQKLKNNHHHVILVLNKKDQYLPQELPSILQQINSRMTGKLEKEDLVVTAAIPQAIKVRKHQPDGTIDEWMEQPAPQIEALKTRLAQVATAPSAPILATIQRQAEALQSQIQGVWNQKRRDRALPAIEQYQWIAATTAFANPIPSLDLLTTGAITGQLILDLAKIYQPNQSFNLQQGQKVAGIVGELIVKLGLVELSTQTITSILKTNTITYTAGGLVQGISAAYLTRIAGLSLIEYFQTQDFQPEQGLNLEKLTAIIKQVFQQNQRTAFVQSFVTSAVNRLKQA
jgi:GTPase SAR1 family protein